MKFPFGANGLFSGAMLVLVSVNEYQCDGIYIYICIYQFAKCRSKGKTGLLKSMTSCHRFDRFGKFAVIQFTGLSRTDLWRIWLNHILFSNFFRLFFSSGVFFFEVCWKELPNTSRIRIPRRTTCLQHEVLNPRRDQTLKERNLRPVDRRFGRSKMSSCQLRLTD